MSLLVCKKSRDGERRAGKGSEETPSESGQALQNGAGSEQLSERSLGQEGMC